MSKPNARSQQHNLNKSAVNLAYCWKITREDGQIFTFTSHDKKLTVSTLVYTPVNAFSDSALEQRSDFSVNNLDMVALTSSTITEGDLLAGKYDNADLRMFAVLDWTDVSKGIKPLLGGKIGEVEAMGAVFKAEVRGNAQAIQQPIVKLTSITCRAELGDSQCKVKLSPSAWASTTVVSTIEAGDANVGGYVTPSTYNGYWGKATTGGTTGGSEPTWPTTVGGTVVDGTVTWTMFAAHVRQGTVTEWYDKRHFVDNTLNDADDWFRFGKVTFTSGLNNGLSMEVREFTGGHITLWEPMGFDIAIGDTFNIQVGCGKRATEDCGTKFSNIQNFDGEPYLPGEFSATEFPDAH